MRRSGHGDEQQDTANLLHGLSSGDSGAAWAAFIDRYAPVIFRAVRQFEFEQERADDCFLYLCEKLCEQGFKRLLAFNTEGPASFPTWLGTVAYNLCVDWHRREYGRATLLPAISALPTFDQAVYRLYFEQAMDRHACRQALQTDFPDLNDKQLSDSIARVHRAMTPRQRWRIGLRTRGRAETTAVGSELRQLADGTAGPEHRASEEQLRHAVREAMDGLTERQRLLLLLRYEQGLTLKKIAELTGLPDPFRARREIQAALEELSAALPAANFGEE